MDGIMEILVLDDKEHARNQVESCIAAAGGLPHRITWLDSAASLGSVAGTEFDIAFVDFFLDKDRACGVDQLDRIRARRLVGFSSKLEASERIARAARDKGFAQTAAIAKLKDGLGNPVLEAWLRALPADGAEERPLWIYRQSGVVPVLRAGGETRVVLVTSRKNGQWIVPKGVVERNMSPEESALKKAREEAGVTGAVSGPELGRYSYRKWGGICTVQLFPMAVEAVLDDWDEMHERKRAVLSPPEAVAAIADRELRALVAGFLGVGPD